MKLTLLLLSSSITLTQSFVVQKSAQHGSSNISLEAVNNRRSFLQIAAPFSAFLLSNVLVADAEESSGPDALDVNDFLKSGMVMNPMGVSGQGGKSRPEIGVVLRDGSDVLRDSKSGAVSAEILVSSTEENGAKEAVFVSFESPWPLAKGTVFDIECRDSKSGDIGAFVAVTGDTKGVPLSDLPSDFFLERLFSPTGRYSFYGPPTDIKVKKSYMTTQGDVSYRTVELNFSNLSQSTQTEIPRKAVISAVIPAGSANAVMIVGGASGTRWRKNNNEAEVRKCVESFRAVQAPKSNSRVRAKQRNNNAL